VSEWLTRRKKGRQVVRKWQASRKEMAGKQEGNSRQAERKWQTSRKEIVGK